MATIATINKRKQYRTVTLKNVFQALNWSYTYFERWHFFQTSMTRDSKQTMKYSGNSLQLNTYFKYVALDNILFPVLSPELCPTTLRYQTSNSL